MNRPDTEDMSFSGPTTGETPSPAASAPAHFGYVDSVRGFAILNVILYHVAVVVGYFPGKNLIQGYGVHLFFLTSAMTLCNSLAVRQQRDKFPVFYFYLRRIFRIVPLFWCGILFYWVFPSVMPASWLSQWAPPGGVHPSYFVLTALFLQGWHPYTFNSIVPGGWSIAVEMTFYLIFPLLFLWLSSAKRAMAAVLVSILYLKLLGLNSLYVHSDFLGLRHLYPGIPDRVWDFFASYWFPTQIPSFLVGFLAYHVLKHDFTKMLAGNRFWAGSLFTLGVLILVSLFREGSGFVPTPLLVVLTMAAMVVSLSGGVLKLVVNPCTRYLGKISYSCFLSHFAAIGLALKFFGIHLTGDVSSFDTGQPWSNLLVFLKLALVSLGLTVAFSIATYHLIESPGVGFGRKLIQRITSLTGGPAPVVKTNVASQISG